MTLEADRIDRPKEDPVSNVLEWVLLAVASASFAILGWTTKLTYEAAPWNGLPAGASGIRTAGPP